VHPGRARQGTAGFLTCADLSHDEVRHTQPRKGQPTAAANPTTPPQRASTSTSSQDIAMVPIRPRGRGAHHRPPLLVLFKQQLHGISTPMSSQDPDSNHSTTRRRLRAAVFNRKLQIRPVLPRQRQAHRGRRVPAAQRPPRKGAARERR
jgi:hypothetical protein